MIHLLPFDIWLHICMHSSVQSLLSLRGTCKYLYNVVEERSVWSAAVRDIVGVVPLRRVRHELPSMTCEQLKRKAMQIARLDNLWSRESIHPVKMERHPLDSGVRRAEVVIGGEFILTLFRDGTLQLHRARDMSQLLTAVHRPNRPSRHYFPDFTDMRRSSSSSNGKNWGVIVDYYATLSGGAYTDFRVYHIDVHTATLRFLTTITRCYYCFDFHATGDFLVTGSTDQDNYLVTVQRIPFTANTPGEELMMNFGPDLLSPRLTMPCPHMILVSTLLGLHLYQIPDVASSHSEVTSPLAVHIQGKPDNGKAIWNAMCSHHDGRISTYTFDDEEDALLVLPNPGQSSADFVRYLIHGPCSMGNSRAVACKDFIDMQPMELQMLTHFTRMDSHNGYVRLGRTKAPDPTQSVPIPLPGQDGRAEDLSWDEESGRICVIFSPFSGRGIRHMLIVDLI